VTDPHAPSSSIARAPACPRRPDRATLVRMAAAPEVTTIYRVVINHEEQYLVLPEADPTPHGWRDAGHAGTHDSCLQFLKAENVSRGDRPRRD